MTTSFRRYAREAFTLCAFVLVGVASLVLSNTALRAQVSNASDLSKKQSSNFYRTKSVDSAAQQPSYPGAPPREAGYPGERSTKAKLEGTMGAVKLRFYGTLLLNISATDSLQVGQDVPLWPIPGHIPISFPDGSSRRAGLIHDTVFTVRQSVLGFAVGQAKPSENSWEPSGVFEFDFFGTRPVDSLQPQGRVLNQPRLRLAYFQLEKGMWRFVAGQDKVIIAPLDPISLSHVAVPLGATAGNLWGWLPQVRVDATRKLGSTTALMQFGVLRPSFSDPRLGDLPAVGSSIDAVFSGFGERATHPFYQARVALSHAMSGSTATVGAGAHYGREQIGATRTLDSWAFAIDYSLPLHPRLILRGEGFMGSNLVPFQGGILQGVAVRAGAKMGDPPLRINKIGSGGGWAELTVPVTLDFKNILYFGAGTDDPRDKNLLPGTGRSKNSFLWASYFRKLTDEVTLAFEWSNWDFQTRTFLSGRLGPRATSGRGNVFNLALAYQF